MLARYEILHELGRSASGVVYAARDRETRAVVALKTFHPPSSGKPGANPVERFLKLARSARQLNHPNIARILDAGEAGDSAYVVTEMIEGKSLRGMLDEGPLPIARAIRIVRDIASGLAYAHLEGVVHGGLKPSNIIVLRSGVVKITDFGIAQAAPGGVSPEQARGDAVDHRSDIFALGALFYEMLTRRAPVQGSEPPLPSELNPHIPRALDRMVASMLARQPADRMAGAPILLRDLQQIEEGLGLSESAPPERATDREAFDVHKAMATMEREAALPRRSGSLPAILAGLAFVLALVGIGFTGFLYYSSGPGEPVVAGNRTQEAPAPAATAPEPAAAVPRPIAPTPQPAPPPPVAEPVSEPAPAPALEEASVAAAPAPEPPEETPAAAARLLLAVSPRGEVYIDGQHHGTTPPITSLDLEPGMHRIEIRSGSRKPYLTYMTVQPGDERRIRHDFNAKRSRLPPG